MVCFAFYETDVFETHQLFRNSMLFKQTNENNCLKVAKAFNTRYFAMRVPRLLKKLPWITLMLVFLIFLIYKYAESQKEVDELRQILIEKHKKGKKILALTSQKPFFANQSFQRPRICAIS